MSFYLEGFAGWRLRTFTVGPSLPAGRGRERDRYTVFWIENLGVKTVLRDGFVQASDVLCCFIIGGSCPHIVSRVLLLAPGAGAKVSFAEGTLCAVQLV